MKLLRLLLGRFGEIRAARGEDDGARCVHDEPLLAAVGTSAYRLREVAVLRADARDEDGHVADDAAHRRKLLGIGGADHRAAVAVAVPLLRGEPGDDCIQGLTTDVQLLYLARA